MYLSRIVLHGFKSFADRTEFDFGAGATVIVGPNGCGKSNVVDAVKWVLGEQSAKSLRGTRMADVIFAGARNRKPAAVAEVALVFDNADRRLASDADEVQVSRLLYRNGDSEYRLNNQVCRLRDIRDLFLDTGVGMDAYSIIEQGRVDVLLQANPVERREIFEEAAGISKYKVRRLEAERKLERSRQNLLRLNDVMEEVEKQLRSVKLAAGKARNYQQYDARLRELRSAFYLSEYHRLVQAQVRLESAVADGEARVAAQRDALLAGQAVVAELETMLGNAHELISTCEARSGELQAELSALAERMAQGEQRSRDYAGDADRLARRGAELDAAAGEISQRIADASEALAALRERVESGGLRLTELGETGRAAGERREAVRQALDEARHAAFEAARREALLHNQQENVAAQRRACEGRAGALAERRQQLIDDANRSAAEREATQRQAAALERSLADQRERLAQIESSLAALRLERDRLSEQVAAAREARSALLSRIAVLEDMERRLEGVGDASRAVLSWQDAAACGAEPSGGVLGLVADLFRVDDPRVHLLDGLLAGFEDHVVVADACAFLAELSRREPLTGPVHVLALDRAPARALPPGERDRPGVLGAVRDWVRCEPRLEALADALFGPIVLVDSVERGLALAAQCLHAGWFVAPDGTAVGPDGRLFVGPQRRAAGLISRKAELRQLRTDLDDLEAGLAGMERSKAALASRWADDDLARRELAAQIQQTDKHMLQAQAQLVRLADDARRMDDLVAQLDREAVAAQSSIEELDRDAQRLAEECERVRAARCEADAFLEQRHADLAVAEAELARVADTLTAAQVEQTRQSEQRRAVEDALRRLTEQRESVVAERTQTAQAAAHVQARHEQLRTELDAAAERRAALGRDVEQVRLELERLRSNRQKIRDDLDERAAAAREAQGDASRREDELHALRVDLREIEVRRETLAQRVRDELSVELGELYRSYQDSEQDWDAVREEIESLRLKIERLGNVNLDALQELEELQPRYDNMAAQRSDLVDSIARIEQLIDELNRDSCERFLATFEAIRGHFGELFRKLFGGGKADIILEDAEQPLECGIEVIARPPGKEAQSISLLSGGEKTMTAVALLLAVFQSRPSPFAIMDEVDAALDESNNERFNRVIREFLSLSQFIIITHSKITMQCGDALYGVTMEEEGVSKRVGVRFSERLDTPALA